MHRSQRRRHTSKVRRTSLNLDMGLIDDAREVLGTNGTTDTVHRALEEIVLRERRARAARLRFERLERADAWR